MRKIALQTTAMFCFGIALSPDGTHMVTTHNDGTLSVYSLPGGEHIRTFGSHGAGKGQFNDPAKLCFSATGNILVAEEGNRRAQEVTLTGGHVRFIGVGVIDDKIGGIAASTELIVVVKHNCRSSNRVMMFDAVTGAFVRAFGDYGDAPGQLLHCHGVRFTPDSRHIIVAESSGNGTSRLSVFTLTGEFVRCIGEGQLKGAGDVDFSDNGDVIVCDSWAHRICVYSADGGTLLQRWGGWGDTAGMFTYSCALAMCGGQLFVLDEFSKRVQVFE